MRSLGPQHFSLGSPAVPAGHLHENRPFVLSQIAPTPQTLGIALQISI